MTFHRFCLLGATLLIISCESLAPLANSPGGQITQAVANEIIRTCGQMLEPGVRDQVNTTWDEYLGQESRLALEGVANVILQTPGLTDEQQITLYRNYVSCGAGLLMVRMADSTEEASDVN
ncbi:MAG: hypothetical protein AAF525_21860 [Pseudomonadota bacterium]